MKLSTTPDSMMMQRLQKLYENSKSPSLLTQKRPSNDYSSVNVNSKKSSNTPYSFESNHESSFYEKYSKIWLKTSIPPVSLKILMLTISKINQKTLGRAFRKLNFTTNDPLAFTTCPKCNHTGLSLLTTSTKNNFSPRFLEKIRNFLPGSKIKCKKNETNDLEKPIVYHSPKLNRRSSDKNSLVLYSEDQFLSPDRKIPISDISEIHPNPYFLSSLSSPDNFQRSVKENKLLKPKDEVSFDISKDSNDFFRENPIFHNLPKQIIPKLNFSELVMDTKSNFIKRKPNFSVLYEIFKERMKFAFDKIYETERKTFFSVSEKAKTQMISYDNRNKIVKKQISTMQQKLVTNSKKTAFKILNSRLEKFIFRRKMQGFYSISELLYR